MSKTVREVETIVANVTEAMVVEGMKAAKDAGLTTTDYFAEADEFASDCRERGRPLIMDSIADDEENFDELTAKTADLVYAAEFVGMVIDRAGGYAKQIIPLLFAGA